MPIWDALDRGHQVVARGESAAHGCQRSACVAVGLRYLYPMVKPVEPVGGSVVTST